MESQWLSPLPMIGIRLRLWKWFMKIKIIGYVWKSQQNGAVYDVSGVSPNLVCGNHAGVEPKIMEVRYEGRKADKDR